MTRSCGWHVGLQLRQTSENRILVWINLSMILNETNLRLSEIRICSQLEIPSLFLVS